MKHPIVHPKNCCTCAPKKCAIPSYRPLPLSKAICLLLPGTFFRSELLAPTPRGKWTVYARLHEIKFIARINHMKREGCGELCQTYQKGAQVITKLMSARRHDQSCPWQSWAFTLRIPYFRSRPIKMKMLTNPKCLTLALQKFPVYKLMAAVYICNISLVVILLNKYLTRV